MRYLASQHVKSVAIVAASDFFPKPTRLRWQRLRKTQASASQIKKRWTKIPPILLRCWRS